MQGRPPRVPPLEGAAEVDEGVDRQVGAGDVAEGRAELGDVGGQHGYRDGVLEGVGDL